MPTGTCEVVNSQINGLSLTTAVQKGFKKVATMKVVLSHLTQKSTWIGWLKNDRTPFN